MKQRYLPLIVMMGLILSYGFLGAASAASGDKIEPGVKSVQSACDTALAPQPSLADSESVRSSLALLVGEIGRGEHAVAYLYRKADGSAVVRKVFFPHALDQLNNDYDAYHYLEKHEDAFPFKLARVLGRGPDDILMELAEGTNLQKLMAASTTSQEIKQRLTKMYMEKLGKTRQFFDERCFDLQYRSHAESFGKARLELYHQLKATCEKGERFLEFIIKSDNIIVNLDNFEMTLIHPY